MNSTIRGETSIEFTTNGNFNINITNNTIIPTTYGITTGLGGSTLGNSNNISITRNEIKPLTSGASGIFIRVSSLSPTKYLVISDNHFASWARHVDVNAYNVTISNNTLVGRGSVSSSGNFGIKIGGNGSRVYNNTVLNHNQNSPSYPKSNGIRVEGTNHDVYNNTVTACTYGMMLTGTNNTVYNNTVNASILNGLHVTDINNTIYNNFFIDNPVSDLTTTYGNNWDNGSIGNYYPDYEEQVPGSAVFNGIWTDPYIIGLSSVDHYSLSGYFLNASKIRMHVDSPPFLHVGMPISIIVEVIGVQGQGIDDVWFTVSNSTWSITSEDTGASISQVNATHWQCSITEELENDALYYVNISANDTNGFNNTLFHSVLINEFGHPIITVISPLGGDRYTGDTLDFEVECVDEDLAVDEVWVRLLNETGSATENYTMNPGTGDFYSYTIDMHDLEPFGVGDFTIEFYANDTADNVAKWTIHVVIYPLFYPDSILITNDVELAYYDTEGGDGSKGSPYVLEGYRINLDITGKDYAIKVQGTTKYFVIKDCILIGTSGSGFYGDGIYLYAIENVTIDSCSIYKTERAIYSYISSGINITSSTIQDVNYGMDFESNVLSGIGNNNITIENNFINASIGITREPHMKNVSLINNTFTSIDGRESGTAIHRILSGSINFIIDFDIINNTFIDIKFCITLYRDIRVKIINNTFTRVYRAIQVQYTPNINIHGNVLDDIATQGMLIQASSGVDVYNNTIKNTGSQAIVFGTSFTNDIHVNDNFIENVDIGIEFYSLRAVIFNNTINNVASVGIITHNSNVTIKNNTIVSKDGSGQGIQGFDVSFVEIRENTITGFNGAGNGYGIRGDFSNSIISNNTIDGNYYGISGNFDTNETIMYNTFVNNVFGIKCDLTYLLEVDDNVTITLNKFEDNTNGIYFLDNYGEPVSITIYKNSFINSICTDYEYNGINWDNGTRGNYWDDYETKYPGAGNNGVSWTTPYKVDATENVFDNYPLIYSPFVTILEPIITWFSPGSILFQDEDLNVTARITGITVDAAWFNVMNDTWQDGNFSMTLIDGNYTAVVSLPLETGVAYTVTLFFNDTDGHNFSITRTFDVVEEPVITIISPSIDIHVSGILDVKATVDDVYPIDQAWYTLNDSSTTLGDYGMIYNSTGDFYYSQLVDVSTFTNGLWTITVYGSNTLGIVGNSSANFLVNTAPSIVDVLSPVGYQTVNTMDISVEATDPNGVDSVSYDVSNETGTIFSGALPKVGTTDVYQAFKDLNTVPGLVDGTYILTVHVIDSIAFESEFYHVFKIDLDAPVIVPIDPQDGAFFTSKNTVTLKIRVIDEDVNTAYFSIDGGTEVEFDLGISGIFVQITPTVFSPGEHSISFRGTSKTGKETTLSISITINTDVPVITEYSIPEPGERVTISPLSVVVSCTDSNGIDTVLLHVWNTTTNQSFSGTASGDFYTIDVDVSPFADGTYSIQVFANDTGGRYSFMSSSVTLDLRDPKITNVGLPNDTAIVTNETTIYLDVAVQIGDEDIAGASYELYQNGTLIESGILVASGTIFRKNVTIVNATDGNYKVVIVAVSNTGRSSSLEIFLTIDIVTDGEEPEPPPQPPKTILQTIVEFILGIIAVILSFFGLAYVFKKNRAVSLDEF